MSIGCKIIHFPMEGIKSQYSLPNGRNLNSILQIKTPHSFPVEENGSGDLRSGASWGWAEST